MCSLVTFLLLLSAVLNTIKQADHNAISDCKESVCSRTRMLSCEQPGASDQTNFWFPIPNWLAGTWEATSELILESYDYRQGRQTISEPVRIDATRTSTIGMQCDSLGRAWYCACTPYERTVETGSFVDHQIIERISVLSNSSKQLTVDSVATVERADKDTDDAQRVFREETITTYKPLNADTIQADFLINDFDMRGHPLVSSRALCYEMRIEPFKVVNQDERGDLRKKFQEFLAANGLHELLARSGEAAYRPNAHSPQL